MASAQDLRPLPASGIASFAAEKQRVALTSVVSAVFLTTMKLGVGLWTGSLGILAEAAHSLLDLVAAAMTVWAVRAAAQPADGRHTYGHGKFENLSALGETVLLLATCVWILTEAGQRLLGKPVEVEVTVWGFVVMAVSIAVDVSRSRALRRVALQTGSQALEADALHFSTDVWSSSVVILGLAAVWLGPRVRLPWLAGADTVAAILVALIVVWVSLQLGRRSVADLLDEAPAGAREAVAAAVAVPGVRGVSRVRVRQSGPEVFVDVTLTVEPGTSIERGHTIADAAERAIQNLLPGADVVVHVEPASGGVPESDNPAEVVRRLAAEHGVPVHGLQFRNVLGRLSLELHAEVAPVLSVAQAHDQVTALEAAVRHAIPRLAAVVTHIEPAARSASPVVSVPHGQFTTLEAVHEVLAEHHTLGWAHDVALPASGHGLTLTLPLTLPPELPIADPHARTESLEPVLRRRLPLPVRVLIHVEPAEPRASV